MSTRGAITRIGAPEGFVGVYHHWDSYPTGLGATLFRLRNGHFRGDTAAMLKVLIDEHPAGWSTTNDKDFNLPIGFSNESKAQHPLCYCHGERSEPPLLVTQADAASIGCEYVYVFTPTNKMLVLSSYERDGTKTTGTGDPEAHWATIAVIDLDGPEPDWKEIDGD